MRVEQRFANENNWTVVNYAGLLALAAKLGVPYNMTLLESGEFDAFFVEDFNAVRENMPTTVTWHVRVFNDANELVYENSVSGERV